MPCLVCPACCVHARHLEQGARVGVNLNQLALACLAERRGRRASDGDAR